jgi:hypothetical protein
MTNRKPKACPISGFAIVSACSFIKNGVCVKTGGPCNMLAAQAKKGAPKKEAGDA